MTLENIQIERFNLHHKNIKEVIPKIIACYQDVFSDGPWHEWKECQKCGMYWGKKDKEFLHQMNFEHCGTPIEDFWKKEDVQATIHSVLNLDSSFFVAIQDEKIVGFCWGYVIDGEKLDDYLKIGVVAQIEEKYGNVKIAYQSEIGVLSQFRGKKIARRMFRARHIDFLSLGADVGVVRTRKLPEPSITYLWFKKLGYETIASYPVTDGRVILAKNLNEINT